MSKIADDLKQRLRSNFPTTQAQFEAADRIEQLEAELERERCLSFRNQVAEIEAERDAAQDLLGHRSQAMTEHYTAGAGKIRKIIPKKS